jgi:hypothetical protein
MTTGAQMTKTMCSRWGAYGAAAYGLVIVMIHNRSRRRQIKYTLPPLKMDDGSCEEEKKSLEEEEEVGFEVERDNKVHNLAVSINVSFSLSGSVP